jgi:hypothetical protein
VLAALIAAGQHYPALDGALRVLWIALLVVGSFYFIWRAARSEDTRSASHPLFWLPRRWQQWIFGEDPDEKR